LASIQTGSALLSAQEAQEEQEEEEVRLAGWPTLRVGGQKIEFVRRQVAAERSA